MKQLKDYKFKIMGILEDVEESRNSDGVLIAHFLFRYCKKHLVKDINNDWSIPLKNIKNLPPFETIRRTRAIIQNDNNRFLPTKKSVREARNIKEENWRNCEVREAKQLDL